MNNLNDEFYTTKETAELLKVNPRTVQRMIADGRIQKKIKVGRDYRIPKSEILKLIK